MKRSLQYITIVFFLFISSNLVFGDWFQLSGPCGSSIYDFVTSGTKLYVSTGAGVYLSSTNGNEWTKINRYTDLGDNVTLAVSGNILYTGSYDNGVFITTDDGVSWRQVNNGLTTKDVRSILISGTNIFAATYGGGVYISTNHGGNWTNISNGLLNKIVISLGEFNSNIYAGTAGGGVYVSTNNGIDWSKTSLNLTIFNFAVSDTSFYAVGGGLHRITLNDSSWKNILNEGCISFAVNGNNLVIGLRFYGMMKSTDYGNTWNHVSNYLSYSDIRSLIFKDDNLFVGTLTGIHLSTNYGESLVEKNKGFPFLEIRKLHTTGDMIIAATKHGSIFRSIDNGDSWSGVNLPLYYPDVRTFINMDTIIYAGVYGRGVFRSTDNGLNWNSCLYSGYAVSFARMRNMLYVALYEDGVRVTKDGGVSWETVNNGLPGYNVSSIVAMDTLLFVSVNGYGIYRSADKGANWTKSFSGSDPFFMACTDSNIYAGTTVIHCSLYRSDIKGEVWTKLNAGLNNAGAIVAIKNNIFLSKIGSVVLSTNNGDTWTSFENIRYILTMAASDKYIFVGTDYNGIYARLLSEMITPVEEIITEIPNNFTLNQNHPNPFNPTTTISFSIPSKEYVTLKIYDALGKEIAVLFNDELLPGTYQKEWSANGLSSGVYFYKLQASNFNQTRKLVLLK